MIAPTSYPSPHGSYPSDLTSSVEYFRHLRNSDLRFDVSRNDVKVQLIRAPGTHVELEVGNATQNIEEMIVFSRELLTSDTSGSVVVWITPTSIFNRFASSPPEKLNFGTLPTCHSPTPDELRTSWNIPPRARSSPRPSGQHPPSSHASYVIMVHSFDVMPMPGYSTAYAQMLHAIPSCDGQPFVDEFIPPPPI